MRFPTKHLVAIAFSLASLLVLSSSVFIAAEDELCYKEQKCTIPSGCIYAVPVGGILVPDPHPKIDFSPSPRHASWQSSVEPYSKNAFSTVVSWNASGHRALIPPPGVPNHTPEAKDRKMISDKPCVIFKSYVNTKKNGYELIQTSEIAGLEYKQTEKCCVDDGKN